MIDLVGNFVMIVKAVASITIVLLMGLWLVKRKVLTQSGVTSLSGLLRAFFLPITFFVSLGSGLSPSLFRQLWRVPVLAFALVCLNGLCSWILVRIAGAPHWFQGWMIMALSFSNVLALPLVFVYSICEHTVFPSSNLFPPGKNATAEFMSPEECKKNGNILLFVAIVFSSIAMWGPCFDALAVKEEYQSMREVQLSSLSSSSSSSTSTDHERETDYAMSSSSPAPPSWTARLKRLATTLLSPATSSQILGISVAMVPPVQTFLFSSNSPISPLANAASVMSSGFVPTLNLILSGSLGLKLSSIDWKDPFANLGLAKRTLFILVFGRMIILPLVSFAAIFALQFASILPNDGLLLLVLYFSFATPSNNGVIVMAQLLGNQQAAELLAVGLLLQYLVGIFSMTALMFLAFNLSELFS